MVSVNTKKEKINLSKPFTVKHFLGQKSPWTKVCLENCPLDNSLLGLSSLGQLLQHQQYVIYVSFSLTFLEVGCIGNFQINQKIKKNQSF